MRRVTAKQALNTALNEAEFRLQAPILRSRPQNVDIVLTKACNLACTFCVDYETPGAKRISLENFDRVARQLFPTARLVSICSGGEPYLHKGLEDLLRIAKRHRVATWVLSNGMLLQESRLRTIIREGLITTHGFSVDGFEAKTVEAIRVNAKLETILENIRMVLRVREEEEKTEPRIIIRYALMRSNLEELPAAVERWGKLGIDKMDTGYLAVCNGIDHQESLYFHQELMQEVFAEARRVAARYPRLSLVLPATVAEEAKRKTDPKRCKAPWRFVKIDTDGRVLPCYRAWEAISMGKVYDDDGERFDDLWNSEKYQALRRTVNDDGAEKSFPYCSRCDYRYGWGDLAQHLGFEQWADAVAPQVTETPRDIDHRRDRRASAAMLPKNAGDGSARVVGNSR
jgi:radical SAM protein with 4Fe4S-binding SPASM domain